ncbi:MAG: tetratricopeptide repeat protein [Planctomycetaceae bacterium]
MSDQPKNKGIPAILRQMMMLSLVAGTSALGASTAIYLQSDKSPADEEKHSNAGADSHDESKDSHAQTGEESHDSGHPESDSHMSSPHGHDDDGSASPGHQDKVTSAKKSAVRSPGRKALSTHAVDTHGVEVDADSPFDEFASAKKKSRLATDHEADVPDHSEHDVQSPQDDPFSVESLGFGPSGDVSHGEFAGSGTHHADEALSESDHQHDDSHDGSGHDSSPVHEFHNKAVPQKRQHEDHADSLHAGVSDLPEMEPIPFDDEPEPGLDETDLHEASTSGNKRTTGASSVTDEAFAASEAKAHLSPSRHERVTKQAVNMMADADEELASGDYVQAMQHYQTLRQKSDGVPGVAILFRLALCAEASGRYAAAIEAYRRISGTQSDPAWAGVARYGEARCLSALKKHQGLQADLLRRAILDETEFLPTVRGEVLHLIGRDLWREQSNVVSTDLLDDKTLVVPEWSADPGRLLDELPMLIHETPVKAGPTEFRVMNLKAESPEETIVRLNCGTTRCELLLRNLVRCCEYEIEVSDAAAQTLDGRTQQVHVTEQNLALLLDGITISAGVAWTRNGNVISIVHPEEMSPDELRQSRLGAAERILRSAVMEIPGSQQAGHSRLALSTLLFEQKRATDALQFLQVQMESSPRSIVETEAAFNLGKCLMLLNQRDDAIAAFLRSIDSSGGLADVRIAAYIFHSRMLLEDNHGKQAIQSMMRGLSMSEGSSLEPLAAIHLASLYLSLGNAQGCNTVLMERREGLVDGPGREGAAFLSALSRFRAAVLADRREREGAAVVSALTEFDAANYCGGHWAVLVASACEELGLSQESSEAYSLALRKLPQSHLRNQTVLKLASHYQADNQLEKARVLLASLSSSETDQLVVHARLRSAELALEQRKPDEAIAVCRLLMESDKTSKTQRASLRIMGQAYELKKDHRAAIYCFAGMLPDGEPPLDADSNEHNSETTGGHDQ